MIDHDYTKAQWPCPSCGNRDIDTLVWGEGTSRQDRYDNITCTKCGKIYRPESRDKKDA